MLIQSKSRIESYLIQLYIFTVFAGLMLLSSRQFAQSSSISLCWRLLTVWIQSWIVTELWCSMLATWKWVTILVIVNSSFSDEFVVFQEMDEPVKLLEKPNSMFYALVEQTGKASADYLTEIARKVSGHHWYLFAECVLYVFVTTGCEGENLCENSVQRGPHLKFSIFFSFTRQNIGICETKSNNLNLGKIHCFTLRFFIIVSCFLLLNKKKWTPDNKLNKIVQFMVWLARNEWQWAE